MAKNPWALPDGFDESTKEALRDLFGALRRSRTHITPEALNALKMGNLSAFSALVDWSSIRSEFSNFKTILSAQARRAALEIYKAGGVGSQLTFDLINERAVEYASKRAGELVVAIEGEMRETIRDIITRSTQGEFTVQQAGKFIRANLPLTPKDSNAVLSYADKQYFRFIRDGYSDLKARIKADAMAEKYADKLIRQRATTIARTETAEASMQGVSAGWRSGVETGLIDNSSQKEWIAEADACDICGPMDGKLVPWDAEFPSGRMAPPQHPNCRCSMAILPPDYTDTPFTGQVYNGNKVKVEFEYSNQIRKHLAGKHDQATHGKGGSTSTPLNAKPSVFSELPDFKVTTENVWAVKGYAGNHAAFAINQQLRAGENPQEAKRLQKVIDESPALDSDLTFIRHVDEKALGELATKPMSDWVGKTLVNKGFTSMASNKKSPRSGPFIHDFDYKRNVKINVIAPKGTRGIKGDEFEAEFILSKNSSFTIIGASKIGNETVVDMVVTGQDG